ncbi:MAG TPA: hypothetical protein VGL56_10350 [Fimbriimonadaceae bacterium]|jgi:hypothetical protein
MATQEDVRRIAMALPGVLESEEHFAFSVMVKGKPKGIIWLWNERVDPKKPKVPNPGVLAIRTANLSAKEMLLGSDSKKFFTEDHYNGYPAILVRLEEVTPEDLEDLILEAWRTKAPKELLGRLES